MKAKITLSGCDDDTTFVVDIPEEAYPILVMIANKSVETSEYGCMPVMKIYQYDELNKPKQDA